MFALAAAIVAVLVLCGIVDGGGLPDSLWWWLMFIAFAMSPMEGWLRGKYADATGKLKYQRQQRRERHG